MGSRRDAIACLLCAVLACARPPPAAPPPRPAFVGAIKQYQPLAMEADARQPGQAVILGTDDADRSTVLPLALAPRRAVVEATYLTRDPAGHAVGATLAVALAMAPSAPAMSAAAGSGAGARSASVAGAPSPAAPIAAASVAATPRAASTPGAAPPPPDPAGASSRPSPVGSALTPGHPADRPGTSSTPGSGPAPDPSGTPDSAAVTSTATAAPVASGPASGGRAVTAWPAALASATLVAAMVLGKDPADVAVSAAPAVPSESAAASALIAAGLAATMTGEPIDPAVAVVGMIEPDGGVGPVVGVPEQLVAAIARGKTRLGVPSGMRLARSLGTGHSVDMVQLAEDHRAQIVELASVHDAYLLLTHKPLPAPVPVGEAEMALDGEALERLGNRYLAWQRRLADEWAPLLQLDQAGRIPPAVAQLVRLAHDHSEQALALYLAGKLARASRGMLAAWVYAAAANRTYGVLAKLRAGDVGGAIAAFTALDAVERDPAAGFARIGARRPTTVAGHLALIAAFQAALRSWSYRTFAAESLRDTTQLLAGLPDRAHGELGSPANTDPVAGAVAPAAVLLLRASAELVLADQELEPEIDRGVAFACTPEGVAALAAGLRATAAAGLRHVDALLVEPLAHRAGLGEDAARSQIAASDADYLVAALLSRWPAADLPRELAASWGEASAATSLLAFAAAQLAHQSSARLLASRGLAVPLDDAGKLDTGARAALRGLVAGARLSARSFARAARIATGEVPAPARLAYQLAAIDDRAGVADQLDALAQLWMSSAFSQAAVALAHHGRPGLP